ncbi:MAG: hypothetical protein RLZZ249_220 [Actinomycetota bacterium]
MKDSDRAISYLLAIEENLELASQLATSDLHEFTSDPFRVLAAEALFIRCGELAKRLARLYPEHFSSASWRMLAQHRDKVAHDYLALDHDMLYLTLQQDLPALRGELGRGKEFLKEVRNSSR